MAYPKRKKIISKSEEMTLQKERLRQYNENNTLDDDFTEDNVSLKYAFSNFIVDRTERQCSKTTLDGYKRMYKKLVEHYNTFTKGNGEEMSISWLVREGAQAFFMAHLQAAKGRDGKPVNQQTINHTLRHYRAFGHFCEDKGFISGFKCPIKEVEPEIKQTYTNEELQKLTKRPKDGAGFEEWRNYTMVVFMLATGARTNSIINIQLKDIDLKGGYITINTTKTHKTTVLGLENRAHRELIHYVNEFRDFEDTKLTDYLFCNSYGQQLTRHGFYKAIATYNKSRGVDKTSPHLFRHTFTKNWLLSGGDAFALARTLTHSSLDMTMKYTNLYSSDIKGEINEHSALSQLRRRSGKTLTTQKREEKAE